MDSPGASRSRPVPLWEALGGQVIGSVASPRRRYDGTAYHEAKLAYDPNGRPASRPASSRSQARSVLGAAADVVDGSEPELGDVERVQYSDRVG